MPTYDVGDVLWIIHSDRPGLMAYQVVEEITKKTLDGEETHYLVRAATTKNNKTVKLNSVQGRIFDSSEEAQLALMENAQAAIEAMIERINENVKLVFKVQTPTVVTTPTATPPKPTKKPSRKKKKEELPPGYQWVQMEDGTKVKMKIPEELL